MKRKRISSGKISKKSSTSILGAVRKQVRHVNLGLKKRLITHQDAVSYMQGVSAMARSMGLECGCSASKVTGNKISEMECSCSTFFGRKYRKIHLSQI